MKKIVSVIAASLFLVATAPAFADSATAGAAPSATAAPVAAAPIDPATAQAVRELFKVMKLDTMMSNAFGQMIKNMPSMIRQMAVPQIEKNTKLTPEQKKAELAKMEKAIPEAVARMNALLGDPSLMTEMMDATVPVYARNFSIDEIGQIAAFYKNGAGAKMLALTPQLMGEAMQISQKIMMPRISKLMAEYTPAAK